MPKLRQRDSGTGYFTKVFHEDQAVIYQITPQGVEHLKSKGCAEEGSFELNDLYDLIDRGWAYTDAQAPGNPKRSKLPTAPKPSDKGDASIADASLLLGKSSSRPPKPKPKPAPEQPTRTADGPGEYDLAGGHPAHHDDHNATAAPVPPVSVPSSTSRPRRHDPFEDERPLRRSQAVEDGAEVDPVWSRWGEWWPDLIRTGIVGLATLIVAYQTISPERIGLTVLILLAGGVLTILVSYPILITLERPVRVTPEQAVRDYYTALTAYFPHFRRAWLLLSNEGRSCREFSSFPEFRAYWKRRLADLRRRARSKSKLEFRLQAFNADKSVGQTVVDASYTVGVYLEGNRSEDPFYSTHIETTLVRGPDRMWYLNDGTLP